MSNVSNLLPNRSFSNPSLPSNKVALAGKSALKGTPHSIVINVSEGDLSILKKANQAERLRTPGGYWIKAVVISYTILFLPKVNRLSAPSPHVIVLSPILKE